MSRILPPPSQSATIVNKDGLPTTHLYRWMQSVSDTLTLRQAKTHNWNGLTTNTALEFTEIPNWVQRITIMCTDLSLSGTDTYRIQVSVNGIYVESNYKSSQTQITTVVSAAPTDITNGFIIGNFANGSLTHGQYILTKVTASDWVGSGLFYDSTTTVRQIICAGKVSQLSGAIDKIRVRSSGTNTFDGGTINIMYE